MKIIKVANCGECPYSYIGNDGILYCRENHKLKNLNNEDIPKECSLEDKGE